jgi:hypothetical protein
MVFGDEAADLAQTRHTAVVVEGHWWPMSVP